MKQAIEAFIQSKKVSVNSQKSYTYDLQQFVELTKGIFTSNPYWSINSHF